MGQPKKKGTSGAATAYVSRAKAIKKLQLSLKDFRRLCILKGIYPVEPPHTKKVNKNCSTNRTYYLLKDIQFLLHEPLIDKFRAFKVYVKRLKKAMGKWDQETTERLRNNEPIFRFDHIVKERYPTFVDALRDADDAISMCFLFSTFPNGTAIKPELIHLCRRLTVEFMYYVMESRSLRKVFVSIKGIYYQAEIMGQTITWVVPHALGYSHPADVDFKIMVTFVTFYSTMLGFINYKLFNSLNLVYPPKLLEERPPGENLLQGEEEKDISEYVGSLTLKLKMSEETSPEEQDMEPDEFADSENEEETELRKKSEEKLKKLKNLFAECKIFLNREVPRESLVFTIRSLGGEVSFDKSLYVGATFDESDQTITHQIVDRPAADKKHLNRYYVQPQWVYDCVNAGFLLPVNMYFPGEMLPSHLSPFVEEKEGDYIPPEKQAILDMQNGITTGIRRTENLSSEEDDSDEDEESSTDDNEMGSNDVKDEKPKTGVALDQAPKRKGEERKVQEKKPKVMKVSQGMLRKVDVGQLAQKEAAEEKRLAIMMMPKKRKHLYNKIVFGQKRKSREVLKLKEKREVYDKAQRALKKQKLISQA